MKKTHGMPEKYDTLTASTTPHTLKHMSTLHVDDRAASLGERTNLCEFKH
jgi:hypothetical protein